MLVVNFLCGLVSNRYIVCCCHIYGCTMLASCPIRGLASVMVMRWGCLEVYVWLKPVWNWRSTTSCMETFAKLTNRAISSSFKSCSWRFLHFINSHCIVISHVVLMNLILQQGILLWSCLKWLHCSSKRRFRFLSSFFWSTFLRPFRNFFDGWAETLLWPLYLEVRRP